VAFFRGGALFITRLTGRSVVGARAGPSGVSRLIALLRVDNEATVRAGAAVPSVAPASAADSCATRALVKGPGAGLFSAARPLVAASVAPGMERVPAAAAERSETAAASEDAAVSTGRIAGAAGIARERGNGAISRRLLAAPVARTAVVWPGAAVGAAPASGRAARAGVSAPT